MLGKGPLFEELFRYETTFVFNNDFPALLEDVPEPEDTGDPLFKYVLFCFFFNDITPIHEQNHNDLSDLQPLEEPAG